MPQDIAFALNLKQTGMRGNHIHRMTVFFQFLLQRHNRRNHAVDVWIRPQGKALILTTPVFFIAEGALFEN